jgi:hypothetical protein
MAQDGSDERVTGASVTERVLLARSVVYEDGELIAPEALDDALSEHGVSVGEDEDGVPVYQDVPEGLSLSACHLAVDLREDPARFLE